MTSDAIINPVREKNEPVLPERGLFYVNPGDAHRISSLVKARQASSHFLFNSRLFTLSDSNGDDFFVAGPSVGAPMAVMTLEKLIALCAKKIIVYGWCGSLDKNLAIGDILLPTWGVPGEGTSLYYPGSDKPSSSEQLRNSLASYLKDKKIAHTTGPVWSTDAIYRETRGKLTEMTERSVMGIDMEFTALASVAAYRGIDLAAIFLVSDELWGESWVSGFREPHFKHMNKRLPAELLDAVESLELN